MNSSKITFSNDCKCYFCKKDPSLEGGFPIKWHPVVKIEVAEKLISVCNECLDEKSSKS
jgi:hypothetical protein